ncbi:MAG: hypothetical protein [Olavius algarvensis Gamma 1 endosymbiont]|nr:MAG: hypothetical protein [Olavius algarvensis Gamma 1 endosymbiont]
MSPERRAKGGLGCPVSHPEHGDTLRSMGVVAPQYPVSPYFAFSEPPQTRQGKAQRAGNS